MLKENVNLDAEFVSPIPSDVLTVFSGDNRHPVPRLKTAAVDAPLEDFAPLFQVYLYAVEYE